MEMKERRSMSKINHLINFLEKICLTIASIVLFSMMILTSFEVLARKFFHVSISGLFEFTADYLMIALVYLPLSYLFLEKEHIRVTLFLNLIPKKLRIYVDKLVELCALAFFVLITFKGLETTARAFQFNEVANNLLAYPLAPAYLLIPIGTGMLAIRILLSLLFWKKIEVEEQSIESSKVIESNKEQRAELSID
jgi:TRAP-type transport system small permease protein